MAKRHGVEHFELEKLLNFELSCITEVEEIKMYNLPFIRVTKEMQVWYSRLLSLWRL